VAQQTYNFTHDANANFTTRLSIADAQSGEPTVFWSLSLRRNSTGWTNFNLTTGTAGPQFAFNAFGFNTTGVYNYDFRDTFITQRCTLVRNSTVLGVTNASAYSVGDRIQNGTAGIPDNTTIVSIGSTTVRLSASITTTVTKNVTFIRDNESLSEPIASGSFPVSEGTTYSFSGFSNAKSIIGNANMSGSFTTAGTSPVPPSPVWQTGTSLPDGQVGNFYSATVVASPVTRYEFVSFGGTAIGGLGFTPSTGVVSGTPSNSGSTTLTVDAINQVGDRFSVNRRTFNINIIQPPPSFGDQSITTTWIKTRNFSAAPDRTVSASDTSSYSIVTSGTGLSPTGWLTINNSGQLSGIPAAVGVYTFRVRASGPGGSTNSSQITLTINPPGNRSAGTGVPIDLTNAKRFDGSNWNTNISIFRRFNGSTWDDITN
jgi:hypothetical protein